jgi:hypothetical protein
MGELKLPDEYYDEESSYSPKKLTARERAQAMGWGVTPKNEPAEEDPTEDLDQSEEDGENDGSPVKTVTEGANERWKPKDDDETEKKEDSGTSEGETKADTADKTDEPETPFSFKGDEDKAKLDKKKRGLGKKKLFAAGSVGLLIVILSVFLTFLSSIKLVNFGAVLSASVYSRSAGVMQDRMTQNIFDASVVEGDGSAQLKGRSLLDRFLSRNIDTELAQVGRDGRFSMKFKDGRLETTKVGDASISLDELTRNAGAGDSYAAIADGFTNSFNLKNIRAAMKVRYEFTNQLKNAVGEEFATEARYLRSRIFSTVADNVGFKFGGWRQAARDFFGKTPQEADIKNKNDEIDQVVAETPPSTGIEALDKVSQKMRDKLKAAVEKKGGDWETAKQDIADSIAKDIENSTQIQEVTGKISTAVLVSTIACMVREAFSEKNTNAIANMNEQQGSLMTLNFQSKVDQVKEGIHVQPEAVAALNHQLDLYPIDTVDDNGNPIKAMAPGGENAPGYLYATNQVPLINQDSVDTPRVRPQVNETLRSIIDTVTAPPLPIPVPGVSSADIADKLCGFALTRKGAITIAVTDILANAVADFFSGGGATLAEEAGGQAAVRIFVKEVSKTAFSTIRKAIFTKVGFAKTAATFAGFAGFSFLLNNLAGQSNGTTFTGAEQGAALVERHYIAGNLVEGKRQRTLGGIKLSNEDAGKQFKVAMDNVHAKWNSKSFATRFANARNPFSFLGMMSAKMPTSFTTLFSSLGNFFGNIGSVFSSAVKPTFALLGTGHASAAATDYSPFYDNQQYGYTTAELDKLHSDPSYSVAYNDDHITPDQIATFDKSIGKCFDASISQNDISNNYDSKNNIKDQYHECDPANLQTDLAFRYRIHLLDTGLATSFYDNTDKGGAVTTPTTPPAADVTSGPQRGVDLTAINTNTDAYKCPLSDTITDAGIVTDAWKNGQGPLSEKMCWVASANAKKIEFNVLVAANFDSMFRAFNAAGYTMTSNNSNGYRTYAYQQQQYQANPGNFAPPGLSNHEFGVALDLYCSGGGTPYTGGYKGSPSDRGLALFLDTINRDPCLNWIHTNSFKYNLLLQCDGLDSKGRIITGGNGGACEPWHISPTGG